MCQTGIMKEGCVCHMRECFLLSEHEAGMGTGPSPCPLPTGCVVSVWHPTALLLEQ